MSSPTRGRFLIINNNKFDTPTSTDQVELSTRSGSEVDVRNITKLFQALSFLQNVHTDLSSHVSININSIH